MTTLSALKPGEKGKIVNVTATGHMKRRLMDMGLQVGEEVTIKRVAPFGDPIEIIVKDYSLSLRKGEADFVSIGPANDLDIAENRDKRDYVISLRNRDSDQKYAAPAYDRAIAEDTQKQVVIAVAGNPNSGKSTMINNLTNARLQVGNWPGVTVEKKEARLKYEDRLLRVVDLPGTYSLSPHTQEQVIARNFLVAEKPDVIVNVVDATNLERNFFLTIQLLELNIPIIIVLNIYDEAQKKGHHIDIEALQQLLGVKVITAVSTKKAGLETLKEVIIDAAENPSKYKPRQLFYGDDLESATSSLEKKIQKEYPHLAAAYPPRWLALKLIERDSQVLSQVDIDVDQLLCEPEIAHLQKAHSEDLEAITSEMRYAKAAGLTREILQKKVLRTTEFTEKVDKIVLNRVLGIPIFLAAMWFMFKLTFDISTPFVDWIDGVMAGPVSRWVETGLTSLGTSGWLISLITEGVIGGVGFVFVFVPVIAAMMFFITFLESCGYMARAAFVMDKAMHSMGLHGNSFIPMLLGFGCNVPGIYATRTLENETDRKLTSLLVPLMSCGARLPVYVLFIGVFFADSAGTVLWSIYLLGIVLAVVVGIIFRRTLFKGEKAMFILELPPYRIPTWRNLMVHTWEKSKHFIIKAGTTILAASVLVWFLLNLPWGVENPKDSLLGKTGQVIAPIFEPLGFGNWEASSALITGVMAKEIVVGTLGVIYASQPGEEEAAASPALSEELAEIGTSFFLAGREAIGNVVSTFGIATISAEEDDEMQGLKPHVRGTFTPLSAYSFMVFVLLYMPCLVTAAAFKHEFGNWNLFGICALYEFLLAWGVAFVVYQGGKLIGFA